MKTTLSIALLAARLLFACDSPKTEPSLDAGVDGRVVDVDASSSTTDAATTSDAATAADAGSDAMEPPTVTCPMARQVPFPEVCNAFDDDCDGRMDEGTCDDPCDQPW